MKSFRSNEDLKADDMRHIVDMLQTRIEGGKNINVRTFGDRLIIERTPKRIRKWLKNWTQLDGSDNGKKLIGVQSDDQLCVSYNGGLTWVKHWPANMYNHTWQAVAVSGDGEYMLAARNNGRVYISSDSGVTWSMITTGPSEVVWYALDISQTGQYMISSSGNGIWVSTDYGATWQYSHSWQFADCCINADGSYMALASSSTVGRIFTSGDFGVTWTLRDSGWCKNCQAIDMDDSGDTIIAVRSNYASLCDVSWTAHVSHDAGATWSYITYCSAVEGDPDLSLYYDVRVSSDGSCAVLVSNSVDGSRHSYLYTTADGGTTWIKRTPGGRSGDGPDVEMWTGLAIGPDAQTIVVCAVWADDLESGKPGYIYRSTDYGVSWHRVGRR